jgi:hypothetical protein
MTTRKYFGQSKATKATVGNQTMNIKLTGSAIAHLATALCKSIGNGSTYVDVTVYYKTTGKQITVTTRG